MYPVTMTRRAPLGFAVANSDAELAALQDAGYTPDCPINEAPAQSIETVSPLGGLGDVTGAAPSVESLRAELTARGVKFDRRWGLDRLQALVAET